MSSPTDLGRLDTAAWERLQDLADRLEALWREQGQVDLHVLLPPAGDPLRLACLAELIKTDLEIRWRSNHGVRLDWYVERFEELGAVSELSPRLIYEEYRARQRFGDKPDLASYKRRFPRQFPDVEKLAQTEPIGTVAPAVPTPATPPPKPPPAMSSNVVVVSEGYKLLERIGAGSFGEVWRAEAPGGIFVAVKKIYRPVGSDADQHEKKALDHIKNLRHPFLLATHAYWISMEGYLHIAMDLADRTLRDRMRECLKRGMTGIPAAELLRLMNQAAQALDYVHSQGLFHRDIKPDNILLKNGFAMVGDFGLVRKEATLSMGSAGAGTLPYMGPEVFLGNVCKYSDQYSLAITYVELRSGGQRPFPPPANEFQAMMAAREGTPNVNMLEAAEQPILLRALAKNPEERFPTCVAFVEALETALRGAAPADAPALPNSWLQPMRRIGPEGYQLLHRLAGNSTVGQFWEAVAPGGKHVALKVIENLDHGGVLKYLRAYDLARCFVGAANVVQVHDRWLADGAGQVRSLADVLKLTPEERVTLIVVMELADDDLAHRLSGSGRKVVEERLPQLLDYLQQVAQALDHLNTRSHTYARRQVAIRHCGIHPENLLLVGDTVRIADFTLAQDATEPSEPLRADNLDLEPGYAAPELLEPGGGRVTEFSDQYSLAMTYVKLRTGSLPFDQSQSRNRVIDDQLEGKLNLQTLHAPERAVIARATARRPEDRYPSCTTFVAALAEACKPPRRATEPRAGASPVEETLEKKPATQRQVFDRPTPAHGVRRPRWHGGEDDGGTLVPRQEETASHFQLHVPKPEVKTEEEQPWPRPMPVSTSRRSRGLVVAVTVTLAGILVVAGAYWKTRPSGNQLSKGPAAEIPPEQPPKDSTKPGDPQEHTNQQPPPPNPIEVKPPKVDKSGAVLSKVQNAIPGLGNGRPFNPFLQELRAATKELDNQPPTLASVCMAECLLETLDPAKDPRPELEEARKLLSGRADLPAEFQAYGAYVQALFDSMENRWEDAIPRLPRPEARPDWFNEHRRGKAADLCYAAAAHFGSKEDWTGATNAQQQAISLGTRPGRFARLAEYALKAGNYDVVQGAAKQHLKTDVQIDLFNSKDEAILSQDTLRVALLGAEAATKAKHLDQAAQWYLAITDKWQRKRLSSDVASATVLKDVLEPGIKATWEWSKEDAQARERKTDLAKLERSKGRLLFEELPDPAQSIAKAKQAYHEASVHFEEAGNRQQQAECLTWEGYLLTKLANWQIADLKAIAEKAKQASAESSGAWFLAGLAEHYQACWNLNKVELARNHAAEAVKSLQKAIGLAGEQADLLSLYHSVCSAARLIQADEYYQLHGKAKLSEYRDMLKAALADAKDAFDKHLEWKWYSHLQQAHVLEDLAWRCFPDDPEEERKHYEKADAEYQAAIKLSRGLEILPIIGRGRMFYRRKAYSNDRNPAWLGEAETELDRALKLGGDKASLGEANLWLGVTCLEMENADKRRKATEAIFQAVRQCDASWADVFLVQVFDEEIQLADRWWDQRPDRGSRESVHRFLDEVRKQCDAFMNRWPDRAMAVAAVKARAAAVEDKFEDAMTLCKDGLKLSPNKDSPKDLIVLLLTKVEVALDESNPLPIDHTDLALSVAQAAERAKKFQLGSGLEARIACWTAYAGYCRDLENKQVTQADWRSVRKSLEEAIEQSPSDAREIPVCRLATAVVCFRLGDYAEADAHARKVRDSKHVTMKQARQAHEVLEKVAPLLSKPKLK